jgi:hypothetical protein
MRLRIFKLVKPLLNMEIIRFVNGQYQLAKESSNVQVEVEV